MRAAEDVARAQRIMPSRGGEVPCAVPLSALRVHADGVADDVGNACGLTLEPCGPRAAHMQATLLASAEVGLEHIHRSRWIEAPAAITSRRFWLASAPGLDGLVSGRSKRTRALPYMAIQDFNVTFQADSGNRGAGPEAVGMPPVIAIDGDNPAIVQAGATHGDIGAT